MLKYLKQNKEGLSNHRGNVSLLISPRAIALSNCKVELECCMEISLVMLFLPCSSKLYEGIYYSTKASSCLLNLVWHVFDLLLLYTLLVTQNSL